MLQVGGALLGCGECPLCLPSRAAPQNIGLFVCGRGQFAPAIACDLRPFATPVSRDLCPFGAALANKIGPLATAFAGDLEGVATALPSNLEGFATQLAGVFGRHVDAIGRSGESRVPGVVPEGIRHAVLCVSNGTAAPPAERRLGLGVNGGDQQATEK